VGNTPGDSRHDRRFSIKLFGADSPFAEKRERRPSGFEKKARARGFRFVRVLVGDEVIEKVCPMEKT
jgi:hypothetical protein